jgi:hypothetical protein
VHLSVEKMVVRWDRNSVAWTVERWAERKAPKMAEMWAVHLGRKLVVYLADLWDG